LRDDAFWQRWDNDSFDKLFTKVRDTMPQQAVDSLSDDKKVDALPTSWPRTARPRARRTRYRYPRARGHHDRAEGWTAPAAVANFNLVQVVGCSVGGSQRHVVADPGVEPATTRADEA
jgi:hypothetical protein